jgi:hypothetical protein
MSKIRTYTNGNETKSHCPTCKKETLHKVGGTCRDTWDEEGVGELLDLTCTICNSSYILEEFDPVVTLS